MTMYMIRDCRDWMNGMASSMRPSRLLDQHFALGLIDDDLHRSPLIHRQSPIHYLRPWRVENKDTGSTVHCDKDGFKVNLDVQQFSPEEIQVKVANNSIVVEGKHEEKQDEHGHISRHFVRRYVVPQEYKVDASASRLSSDGVLTISAPRVEAIEDSRERVIPITQTRPHKAVDCKKDEENNK